jgi:hypothetical protein
MTDRSRVHWTPFKGRSRRPYSPMTTDSPAPAGATHSVRVRAAHLGRPGGVSARTLAHPPSSDRPSVLVPTPRPRSVQATASKGVVVDSPSRVTVDAGCQQRSRCDSLVRFAPRRLTPSFSSAGRTRGRPTGTAGWGRPSSNLGGTLQHRLADSHCPPERPPYQSSSLGRVAGLRRTHNYGSIRDQPG